MTHRHATTCIQCGAAGEGESETPGIVHKTILCDECKAKTTAAIKLHIQRDGIVTSFQIAGSDAWLNTLVPNISYFLGTALRSLGLDSENLAAAGNELSEAMGALMKGNQYEGKFLAVARSEERASADSAINPGQ